MRAWRRTSGRGCCWASDRARARLALGALLALTACSARPSAPITTITVQETAAAEAPLDRAEAERWTGQALERIDGLRVRAAQPGERRWQATVRVGRRVYRGARPEDGGVLPRDRLWREVEVVLELRAIEASDPASTRASDPASARPLRLSGARYTGFGRAAENVGVFDDDRALIERAIGDAVVDLTLLIDLEVAPDDEVVARLSRGDTRARTRAIEVAGARRIGAAVDALVALVPDTALGSRATGALVAIGDPRAVGALIESAKERPLLSIVYAVAQIGGKEAEAWLFTMSSGHPDAGVRAAATEALGELERRRDR